MSNDVWYNRTALIWERRKLRQPKITHDPSLQPQPVVIHQPSPFLSYWSEISQTAVALPTGVDDDNKETEICSLSYLQYLQHIMTLSLKLREMLRTILSTDSSHAMNNNTHCQTRVVTIPVAVAIPEGPWLPIAIAAVHVLNEPFRWTWTRTSSDTWISVALLPLDPSDGYERLLQMLQDVRPAIVVTASAYDQDRLQRMALEISANPEPCVVDPEVPIEYATAITVMNVNTLYSEDCEDSINMKERIRATLLTSLRQKSTSGNLPLIWSHFHHAFDSTTSTCASNDVLDDKDFAAVPDELRISHIVFTSGSTGKPKGCVSSITSLRKYIIDKNNSHCINSDSVVLLASAISFDPCMSDILATFAAQGTLALARRDELIQIPGHVLKSLRVTHVLCTPTLWGGVPTTMGYPKLRVVALGGEPIPRSLVRIWKNNAAMLHENFKILATYGVTEACVYQTVGEVEWDDNVASKSKGQDVGRPFMGINVRICSEAQQEQLIDIEKCGYPDGLGEIILAGGQLDQTSSYFGQKSLSARKFIYENGITHYRTGDRGYFDQNTNHLFIVGRIEGEEGTININGIRVELGEIEASLVDDSSDYSVVTGAIAVAVQDDTTTSTVSTELHAYVVLSQSCLEELDSGLRIPDRGVLCCDTPLLTLLRERCRRKARVTPTAFVIVPFIPMSATGKRDRRLLPPLHQTLSITEILTRNEGDRVSLPLQTYGRTGLMIVEGISKCLNLQTCQMKILSTTTTFAMLGGDSLTATRLVRALHARYYKIQDSRFIGGNYGALEGPFAVRHLYRSRNLGEYADWLDSQGICASNEHDVVPEIPVLISEGSDDHSHSEPVDGIVLYEALLQSISLRFISLAMALLDIGADPNIKESEGRMGKISDRNTRKKQFRSNPLHLACLHGDPRLVKYLLDKGARHSIPNASSLFPIHLAAGGDYHRVSATSEDDQRLLCVQLLLQAGCPLGIRDGSKQTIVHAAARGGFVKTLNFIMKQWRQANLNLPAGKEKTVRDMRDNWGRTPVHWAVLHGHSQVLEILLRNGFSAAPPKLKDSRRRTSVANESPMEICSRLYETDPTTFQRMKEMLERN